MTSDVILLLEGGRGRVNGKLIIITSNVLLSSNASTEHLTNQLLFTRVHILSNEEYWVFKHHKVKPGNEVETNLCKKPFL